MKQCSHCHRWFPSASFRIGGEWHKQCVACHEKIREYDSLYMHGYIRPQIDYRFVREVDMPERQRRIALYTEMVSEGVAIEYETTYLEAETVPRVVGIVESSMIEIELALIGKHHESER